jgi:hypothetical protein
VPSRYQKCALTVLVEWILILVGTTPLLLLQYTSWIITGVSNRDLFLLWMSIQTGL